MELKEDKRYDLEFLDYKTTKTLEFLINRLMSRKFDWFNSFKLNSVLVNTMSPWEGIHVFYMGVLNVDENWGERMWIEEGQYGKFPGNEVYDFEKYSGVLLNELIGSRMMSEISEVFNTAFKGVKPIEETPKVSRVGRLLLHFDESKKEDNLQEQIRRILKEETDVSTYLRRRIGMLDYEIEYRLSAIYRPNNICQYENEDELLDVIMEAAIDSMYWNYFANIDDNSGEWANIYYDMVKYIRDKYGDEIRKYYIDNCGSKKKEMGESELTEKCWTGYTQKGMKTMFGKRYPNCVKKTKK
jgi:hypothetical protein